MECGRRCGEFVADGGWVRGEEGPFELVHEDLERVVWVAGRETPALGGGHGEGGEDAEGGGEFPVVGVFEDYAPDFGREGAMWFAIARGEERVALLDGDFDVVA